MVLILTVTASPGSRQGDATRQVFTQEGGTIGRAATNTWVLTHNKVSGRHAVISFRGGVFYIQDTSRNGVSINTRDNRLVRDRPYPLHPGDCIFIEPYEIDVAVDAASDRSPRQPAAVDPFGHDDPFGLIEDPVLGPSGLVVEAGESSAVDPVDLIDGARSAPPPQKPQRPAPVAHDDLLRSYVERPVVMPDPTPPRGAPIIPKGYNPLEEDPGSGVTRRPIPEARPVPEPRPFVEPRPSPEPAPPSGVQPQRPKPGNVSARDLPPAPPVAPTPTPAPEPVRAVVPPVTPAPPVPAAAPPPAAPPAAVPSDDASRVLQAILAGAGVPEAVASPELATKLGEIIRIVVGGLIEVLHARNQIKEEFDIGHTVFRQAFNNPLKFSANIEDALHNLLVKRNAAFLGPVDAFADAFADLRHHELAMLEGMRAAFKSMLAGFDPDVLQKEFDQQIAKAGLALVPAKLRYWELYRDKCRDLAKDPDAAFDELFGEEFARTYDEQFRTLKAQSRGRGGDNPSGDTPGDA